MSRRLTLEERHNQQQAERDALDRRLDSLVGKHSLQTVVESLRRVVNARGVAETDGHYREKWKQALNIIKTADNALYGQHCGDVPPEWERGAKKRR